MNQIDKARIFQRAAHGAMGQVRKFSGLPYHVHPEAVHEILCTFVPDADEDMQVAALLHDVLEDTGVTEEFLRKEFGSVATGLVAGLTNWKPKNVNRAGRHRYNVNRLKGECSRVKTIKLADCLHNLPDIIRCDVKHAKVYVPEKRILLDEALRAGNVGLWNAVDKVIREYYAK